MASLLLDSTDLFSLDGFMNEKNHHSHEFDILESCESYNSYRSKFHMSGENSISHRNTICKSGKSYSHENQICVSSKKTLQFTVFFLLEFSQFIFSSIIAIHSS